MSFPRFKSYLNSLGLGSLRLPDRFKDSLTAHAGIHFVARRILHASGYRFELRRSGDVKLGVWRKTFHSKSSNAAYPRRFVMIPGFGDTPLSWHGVMVLLTPLLKRNFDEHVVLDFPGFGGWLSHERAFPSFDLMRAMVADTLDSLKPHTILGHSLGGWLTAHYASECGKGARPSSNRLNYDGPKKIFLVNPAGIFSSPETRSGWESLFLSSIEAGFDVIRPHLFAKEPAWFGLHKTHFSNFFRREDIHQFMKSFREDHLAEAEAKHISAEAWVVWGERDTLIPSSCASAWLKSLDTKARAVYLRGVGHSPQLEAPGLTAAVVGQLILDRVPHRAGRRFWQVVGE